MVVQQGVLAITRQNPGRPGDVARPTGTFKAVNVAIDQPLDARHHVPLVGVPIEVTRQEIE